jgi:hypothetical protein
MNEKNLPGSRRASGEDLSSRDKKRKRDREAEEEEDEEEEETSKTSGETLLRRAYLHDRSIARLNREMSHELNATLRAYPDQILSAFARRYLFLSEKIREEHAEWLEQLNESLLEAGATKAKARVTDAYYEQHVVANNRAKKRAKREEGAKDGLGEGSSDVNI